MKELDYIYFDYIFKKIVPNNKLILLYCKIRKTLSIGESPSKIIEWQMKRSDK